MTPAAEALRKYHDDHHVGAAAATPTTAAPTTEAQKLTARVRALRDLGLINPYGVAIKHGKPMPQTEQFADHFVVTLTTTGQQALATTEVP